MASVRSSVQIDCRCYGNVEELVGSETVTVEIDGDGSATVGDVLDQLAADVPSFESGQDELNGELVVMKDGTHVRHLDGRATPLSDGDRLTLADPISE